MSYSIQWRIKELSRELQSGYVFKIHFAVEASCKPINKPYVLEGCQCLARPETLIPYEQLTEDLVVQWLYTALGEEGVRNLEAKASAGLSSCVEMDRSDPPWAENAVHLSESKQKNTLA